MARPTYQTLFIGIVFCVLAAVVLFNVWADHYILSRSAGESLETVAGFERAIKPAWLDSVQPEVVFVGSSRVRSGFDPALIDKIFSVRSFNYGVSSVTPYEARRFVQDAAATGSVKTIILSLDPFADENLARHTGPGFAENELAVTADGAATANRWFWLFLTRYLSGSAFGMHALGIYTLMALAPRETAAMRPDLFEAYDQMTEAILDRDQLYRRARAMRLPEKQRRELLAAMNSVCHRQMRLIAFFPPDNEAIIARYEVNDAAGLAAFKATVVADAVRQNAGCTGKVEVFDFMRPNAITTAPLINGKSENYIDLIHFRPGVGVRLFRVMTDPAHAGPDAALGTDLAAKSAGE